MDTVTTADLLSQFEKNYGKEVVRRDLSTGPRLSFGIFALDVALGGGIPAGKVCILYGPEYVGKTNHAMCLIREFQKRHPEQRTAYMDIEGTMEEAWMEAFGIDLEKVHLLQPDTAEQSVDMAEQLLMADDLGLLVFDSLAMLITAAETERSAEVANVGGAGLVIGKLVRKTNRALMIAKKHGNTPTVVWINQIRSKIATGRGNPEIMPGGKGPLFAASTIIRFGGRGENDTKVHANLPVYMDTNAGIKKAKYAYVNPNAEYKMALIKHGEILVGRTRDFPSVKRYAQEMGILVKAKKGWAFMGDEYPTLDAMWAVLRADVVAFDKFKEVVVESMLPKNQIDPDLAETKAKKTIKVKKKVKAKK